MKAPRADSRQFDPNNQHTDSSTKLPPLRTRFILETLGPDDTTYEYRIGIVSRADVQRGLRMKDGIRLNRPVAEKCFTGEVYPTKIAALEAAEAQANADPDPDCGLKIIRCNVHFNADN